MSAARRPKYYSLGDNCEVALQLQRIGRLEDDDFFRWHATLFPTLIKLLEADFASVCADDQLERHGRPEFGVLIDRRYELVVHSPFVVDGVDNFRGPSHDRLYRFFAADIARRAEAFRRNLSGGGACFFCKYGGSGGPAAAAALAELMRRKAGHGDFLIVFVQEAKYSGEWSAGNVLPVYIEKFAPWDHTDRFDAAAWDAVFETVAASGW